MYPKAIVIIAPIIGFHNQLTWNFIAIIQPSTNPMMTPTAVPLSFAFLVNIASINAPAAGPAKYEI